MNEGRLLTASIILWPELQLDSNRTFLCVGVWSKTSIGLAETSLELHWYLKSFFPVFHHRFFLPLLELPPIMSIPKNICGINLSLLLRRTPSSTHIQQVTIQNYKIYSWKICAWQLSDLLGTRCSLEEKIPRGNY